jgi:hypothetical protein
MNDPLIETTVCHECYAVLDAGDNYCRRCGANLTGLSDDGRAAVRPVMASVVERPKFSESPWVVLPMLFLVFGPLALPLLWRSRRFTRLWKIVLTVIMAVVTVYLIWSIWYVLNQSLAPLRELEKLQRF